MLRTSSHSVRHDAVPETVVVVAARQWAARLRAARPEVIRVGYFGSYARGDYVPGSDFDALVEVSMCDIPRRQDRMDRYGSRSFPIGMNLFVYTTEELDRLRSQGDGFLTSIEPQIRWL